MELLEGTRTGDGIVLLSGAREISRDNLWAIRALVTILLLNGFINGTVSSGAAATGMVTAAVVLYAFALWLASAPINTEDANEPTTTA